MLTRAGLCGGGNAPPCSPTGFIRYPFGGGDYHPLTESGGESVMAALMPKLFSVGTIGRDVRRRFRGGVLRALHDAG